MADELIRALVELTENKLVTSIVPVLLGAGLLAWWFKIRDRRNAIRDESLKFVNETADLLNKGISPLFSVVRRRSIDRVDMANKAIGDLFEHRLSIRAKSIALLALPDFWREYDAITWQLRECVDSIEASSKATPVGEVSTEQEHPRLPDWEALICDAKEIWRASATLIEAGIDRALRGTHPKFPPRAPGSPESMLLRND